MHTVEKLSQGIRVGHDFQKHNALQHTCAERRTNDTPACGVNFELARAQEKCILVLKYDAGNLRPRTFFFHIPQLAVFQISFWFKALKRFQFCKFVRRQV